MKWLIAYGLDNSDLVMRFYSTDRQYADTENYRNHITFYRIHDLENKKTFDIGSQAFRRLVENREVVNVTLIGQKDMDIYNIIHKPAYSFVTDNSNSTYKHAKWSDILIDNVNWLPYQTIVKNSGKKVWLNKESIQVLGYNKYGLVALDYSGKLIVLNYDNICNKEYNKVYRILGIDLAKIYNLDTDESIENIRKELSNLIEIKLNSDIEKELTEINIKNDVVSIIEEAAYHIDYDNTVYIVDKLDNLIVDRCNNLVFEQYKPSNLLINYNTDLFQKCKHFEIKQGLRNLPDNSLINAKELLKLRLPIELETIGNKCITNTKLEELDLSKCKNLRSIGSESISHNIRLKVLRYPNNLTHIGAIGYDNPQIRELTLPYNCCNLNTSSFYRMTNLEKLGLPGVKTKIEGKAQRLSDLVNLKEIWTPRINLELAKYIQRHLSGVKINIAERVTQ